MMCVQSGGVLVSAGALRPVVAGAAAAARTCGRQAPAETAHDRPWLASFLASRCSWWAVAHSLVGRCPVPWLSQ